MNSHVIDIVLYIFLNSRKITMFPEMAELSQILPKY